MIVYHKLKEDDGTYAKDPEDVQQRTVRRYRWARAFSPAQGHSVCKTCQGLCCSVPDMRVMLTFPEMTKIRAGKSRLRIEVVERKWKVKDAELEAIAVANDAEVDVPKLELPKREQVDCVRFISSLGDVPEKTRRYIKVTSGSELARKWLGVNRQRDFDVVYALAKKKNGVCLYFNEIEARCGIYRWPERPTACKAWHCGRTPHAETLVYSQLQGYAERARKKCQETDIFSPHWL